MKLTFKGKTALVTGGSGGIGLSIVQKLIENHIKVIIFDKNNINKRFSKNKYIEFIKLDLSKDEDIKNNLEYIKKKYKKIDYLINAAGVLWFNNDVSLEKISLKIWDKVMDINLRSIVIISQTILPLMKKINLDL